MASFRMEMRKFEINYAKIRGGREQMDPRFKMQFDDGSMSESGVRLRESPVRQLHPDRFLPSVPLRPFQTVILRSEGATPKQ